MAEGFVPSPHLKLASQQNFTAPDVESSGKAVFSATLAPFLRKAIERADGSARKTMFEAVRSGAGTDQRCVVENPPIPLAVANGSEDPFINLDYLDRLHYAHLWEKRCHQLPGLGHAPFWEAPELFNPFLERFLRDVSTGAA